MDRYDNVISATLTKDLLSKECVGAIGSRLISPAPSVIKACIFDGPVGEGDADLAVLAQAVRHRLHVAKAWEGVGARLPILFVGERERRKSGSAKGCVPFQILLLSDEDQVSE